MPPNIRCTGVLTEQDAETVDGGLLKPIKKFASDVKFQIVWRSVVFLGLVHVGAVYGLYLLFTTAKWATVLWTYAMYLMSGFGITAGVHRLWSHKAFKAKWPLRLILAIFNTMAHQDSVIHWSRDHRVHHKYSETDADPHNAMRGFFFAHVGWLLVRKHPEIKAKGKEIDMSDLYADPILVFQHKYYLIVMPLIAFILPTVVPMYFWGETFSSAFYSNLFRYAFVLNATWFVNSAAHFFGNKPFDKSIHPGENLPIAIFALGEGFHNFHHVFPWDYRGTELNGYAFNFTNAFIEFFVKIGWASDLKTVSSDVIELRAKRTGDGSHNIWGFGDKDQDKEEIELIRAASKKLKH